MLQNTRRIAMGLGCLLIIAVDTSSSAEPGLRPVKIDALLERMAENTRVISQRKVAIRHRLGEDRGICASDNFSVMCSTRELDSREVLAQAESLRRQIAMQWFGAELREGDEFTLIDVQLSSDIDEGLTLLVDRPEQGHHRVWLTTSKERALGSTLAHEVAHVVLRARYPKGMPAWANEGVASLYDDAVRKERRRQILASLAKSGTWPIVASVLDMQRFTPTDEQAYALGVSLTEFLLSRGSRRQFLEFVERGMNSGWTTALSRVYDIPTPEVLQNEWKTWVARKLLETTVAESGYQGRLKS